MFFKLLYYDFVNCLDGLLCSKEAGYCNGGGIQMGSYFVFLACPCPRVKNCSMFVWTLRRMLYTPALEFCTVAHVKQFCASLEDRRERFSAKNEDLQNGMEREKGLSFDVSRGRRGKYRKEVCIKEKGSCKQVSFCLPSLEVPWMAGVCQLRHPQAPR